MIRRKYSAYLDSHRESRLDVICAGIHDDEAVVGLPVRRGGRSSQLWLAVPQVGREPTTDIRATDDQSLRLQLVADHYVNDGLQVPPPRETGWTIVSRFMNNADKGYPRASRRRVQHVQAVPQRAPPTHIPAPVPRACMWHMLRAPPRQSRRNHREFRSSYRLHLATSKPTIQKINKTARRYLRSSPSTRPWLTCPSDAAGAAPSCG